MILRMLTFVVLLHLVGCASREQFGNDVIVEIWEYGKYDQFSSGGESGMFFPEFSQLVFYESGKYSHFYGVMGGGWARARPNMYFSHSGDWSKEGIEKTISHCSNDCLMNESREGITLREALKITHRKVYSLNGWAPLKERKSNQSLHASDPMFPPVFDDILSPAP